MAAMRAFRVSQILGLALATLSAASIVQSVREMTYRDADRRRYVETPVHDRMWHFGGHDFAVVDSFPTVDHPHRETGRKGSLQLLIDGAALDSPSPAVLREARTDLGRYVGYFHASVFEERATGHKTLWMARAIVDDPADPWFQVFEVNEDLVHEDENLGLRVVKRSDHPSADSRERRVLQLVGGPPPPSFPLSVLGFALFWPLLLVYPAGTLLAGLYLIVARP
jgi:hypothetical protein